MANKIALGLVIGGAVSSTVGAAFKDVTGRIKRLEAEGNKARVLQRTIGDTIRLREEWKKAHDTGAAGASKLLNRLNSNLDSLKKQGIEVGRLEKAYRSMGQTANKAELKAKGHQQIDSGVKGMKGAVGAAVVGVGALAVPTKVSADFGAIVRDIAIKAGIANKPQEQEMSRKIIDTSRDTGMARIGAKLQRVMRGVDAAQAKVGQVVAVYGRATRAAAEVQERLGTLKEQAGKAATAINNVAGKVSPALANIVPTSSFAVDATPAPEAVKPFPHLMIIQPRDPKIEPYYFNLDTAAFDELSRSTEFRWASQERLTRRPAKQAIGMGDEKLTLKGTIYPGFKGGLKQLDTLRSIGARLQPLTLTTGYGEVIGTWCLKTINDEQGAFLHGGIPRKMGFSLEFERYGEDMQDVWQWQNHP